MSPGDPTADPARCPRRRRSPAAGRRAALRQDAGARRREPRYPGRLHRRLHRPGRGGQVDPALADRGRPGDPGRADRSAGRRHGRCPAPPPPCARASPTCRRAGQEPLSDAVGVREHRFLRAACSATRAASASARIAELLQATGLAPFADRPAGKLSGGMKQKLGLCCALIHDPDLLILDEPTTGVDPLSRRQFWELIERIRADRPGMSVLIATAYMEEAARFDWLVAMNAGRILATGAPRRTAGAHALRHAGGGLRRAVAGRAAGGYRPVVIPPREPGSDGETAIEARDLTMRFGDFTAVDHVSFRIERGEIFGFLGSNGCGKTTTMKMLTGLLPASEGQAWLFGHPVDPHDLDTRKRVGYMTQSFSLYGELTVRQNLVLHARIFAIPEERIGPAHRGDGAAVRSRSGHGPTAGRAAAGPAPAPVAGGGDDPLARRCSSSTSRRPAWIPSRATPSGRSCSTWRAGRRSPSSSRPTS